MSPVRASPPGHGPAAPRAFPGPGRRARKLLALLVLAVGIVVVRLTLVAPVQVSSTSMTPTLDRGDVVLVTRGAVRLDDLERQELVTFRSPEDGRRALKRIVGMPGDVLVIRDSRLFVNERPVAEPYVDHRLVDGYYSRTYRVPPRAVFVLGDNRGNSIDSRDYGAVPVDAIEGVVLGRVWSSGWVGR